MSYLAQTLTTSSDFLENIGLSPKYPVVITTETPVLKSIPVVALTKPSLFVPKYLDLNKDPSVHKRMVNYVYYKMLDKWLSADGALSDVLEHLKVSGGKVVALKSDDDNIKNNSQKDIKAKVKYIEDKIITKKDIKRLLTEYTFETDTNWYDIPKNTHWVKKLLRRRLKKLIKKEA